MNAPSAGGTRNDGEPVFTKFRYGKGWVVVVNAPVDRQAVARTDCLTGPRVMPYYLMFREAAKIAGVRTKVAKGDCPYVAFTEHPAPDGSTVVVGINFEPRAITCPVALDGARATSRRRSSLRAPCGSVRIRARPSSCRSSR